jgi:hypothetical protein
VEGEGGGVNVATVFEVLVDVVDGGVVSDDVFGLGEVVVSWRVAVVDESTKRFGMTAGEVGESVLSDGVLGMSKVVTGIGVVGVGESSCLSSILLVRVSVFCWVL